MLGLGTLVSHGFGLSLAAAMLPRISGDLALGYGPLGVALAAGLVSYAVGGMSAGRILGSLPSRGLLMATYAVTAVGLLIAAAATSAVGLAAGAVVTGFIAPVSWAATLHIAAATTDSRYRSSVMASAAGGAALGVLVNGVLVQTSQSLHTWRVSFVIAATFAILPIVGAWIVYRTPVHGLGAAARPTSFSAVLRSKTGRLIVVSSIAAGIVGFPFATFLTATALDEMGVSSIRAGALWWIVGIVGLVAGPVIGRIGDRRTPIHALAVLATAYLTGLVLLVALWSYTGLLIAVVGFAAMNYPIWGVLGAAAEDFDTAAAAVRAITLGLTGAAIAGAVGNAAAGAWIDATGSFRGPVLATVFLTAGLALWFAMAVRGRVGQAATGID